MPTLCFTTFPVCREEKAPKASTQLFNLLKSNQQDPYEESDNDEFSDDPNDSGGLYHEISRKREAKYRDEFRPLIDNSEQSRF